MKFYTPYIILFSFWLVSFSLSGQNVTLKTNSTKYPSNLETSDRTKVVASVRDLLNEYATAATLLDNKQRKVTSNSINQLRGLFNPTARVIKDYEEYIQGESIDIRTYTDQIFNRMLRTGLKVKIESASLKEVKYDPDGYWIAIVELDKSFYNAATASQEVKDISSGRFMKQLMQVDIKVDDLERVKISSIKCLGCETVLVDDFVRYMGPSIGLSTGAFSPSLSSYWNNNHASSSFETSGGLGFSIGVDFMTNAFLAKGATQKKLFLLGGLRYSTYQMSTEVSDFELAPFSEMASMDNISLPYQRSAREVSFTEDISVGVLEIPLGVAYRLKSGIKSDFLIGVKLVPSFVLAASGDISGTGTYDAEITEAMWRLLEAGATNPDQLNESTKFGPFQAGANLPISENADPSTAGFLLAAQISPTYYLHLSEEESSWSILVGLDLNLHLGSFLSHDDASSDILKFNDDYSSSFLQHYTDGMSAVTFGFRIGLHHRLTSRP